MKGLFLSACLLFSFILSTPVTAKPISPEKFFKNAQYRELKLSPDGKHIAFSFAEDKEVKFAILNRETKQITTSFGFGEYTKVTDFYWATNERVLIEYVRSVGFLDESQTMPTLVASNVDGTNQKILFQRYNDAYRILSMLEGKDNKVLIAKYNTHELGVAKTFELNIFNGKTNYTADEPYEVNQLLANRKGEVLIGSSYIEDDEHEFGKGELVIQYRASNGDDWKKFALPDYKSGDSIVFRGFSADEESVYYTSSVGKGVDNAYKFNLKTGENRLLFESELVNFGGVISGPEGIIGLTYMPDKMKILCFDDEPMAKKISMISGNWPDSIVLPTSFTDDGSEFSLRIFNDKNAGDYFLLDLKQGSAAYLASIYPALDPKDMVEVRPITVTARDGMVLHGYLTLPKDSEKGNPLIVNPHGGPHGPRDSWGFNPETQFLANHGYAVLQINFRGSGGYGSKFMEAGYRKWGREMQNDVTDATLWAVEQGYADKDRMCIYGGSYGGYAALMGVIREPDLYQCVVGYVGVYSLPLMREDGDIPSRPSGVRYLDRVIGANETELKANSAVFNVDKIKADIMLVHGKNDQRVPYSQYEALAAALNNQGTPFESIVEENEGHGFVQYENKVNLYTRMLAFFDKHIGK